MSASSSGAASLVQSAACRCCLAEGCDKDMLTQYRCSGVEEVYADMLKETFDLEFLLIAEDDPDPHHICDNCIIQLRQAFRFKQRAIRCAGKFQQRLDAQGTTGAGCRKSTTPKQEQTDSEDDDDDADATYEPECCYVESLDNDTDYIPPTPRKKETLLLKRKMKLEVKDEPKRAKVQEPGGKTEGNTGHETQRAKVMGRSLLIKQYGECKIKKIETVEPKAKHNEPITNDNEPKIVKVQEPGGEPKGNTVHETQRANVMGRSRLIKRYGECEIKKIIFITNDNEPKRAVVLKPTGTTKNKDGKELSATKIRRLKANARKKDTAVSKTDDADITVADDNAVPDDLLMLLEWSNISLFHYKHSAVKKYYKCFVCPETFAEAQTLRAHTEAHDKAEVVIKVLRSKLDALMIAEISYLKCKCGQSQESLADLMTHLTEAHEVPFEQKSLDYLETYKIVQNGYKCDLCDVPTFNFFGKLRLHMRETHQMHGGAANIDLCDQCGQLFQGAHIKRRMQDHKLIAHGIKKTKTSKAVQNVVDLIFNSTACPFHWPTDRTKPNNRTRPYKCFCCSQHFEEFAQLRAHFASDHNMTDMYDQIMLQGFTRQPLKLDISNLSCLKCGEPCEDLDVLRAHLSAAHGMCVVDERQRILPLRIEADGYKCPVCETAFDGWMKLNRHMRVQCEPSGAAAARRWECRDCSRTFVGKKTWRDHMKKIHSNDNMQQTTALRANTKILLGHSNMTMFTFEDAAFRCFTCHETFQHFPELMTHSATHDAASVDQVLKKNAYNFNIKTDITDLKCKLCQTPFDGIEEFAKHLVGSHDVKYFNDGKHNLVPYFVRDDLKCGFCKQSFKANRTLIRHVNTHISEDICDICGIALSNTWTLRKHVQRVHGEIKCKECNVTFKSFGMRRKHKAKFHKGEARKKYESAFCKMKFPIAEYKYKHIIDEHGDEMPEYTCDICFKKCQTKRGFQDHMKTHKKRKATAPCKYCDRGVVKENLEEHVQKLHIEGLKYRCYVCRKQFASPDLLCDHLVAHSDDASYCPLCEYLPDNLDSLVNHLKTLHKIDNKFDSDWAEIKSRKREKATVVRGDRAHVITNEETLLACDNITELQ